MSNPVMNNDQVLHALLREKIAKIVPEADPSVVIAQTLLLSEKILEALGCPGDMPIRVDQYAAIVLVYESIKAGNPEDDNGFIKKAIEIGTTMARSTKVEV